MWPRRRREEGKKGKKSKDGKEGGEAGAGGSRKRLAKAHTRDSLQALSKLGELVDGRYRIVSQPPVVVPFRDLAIAEGMTPRCDPG